MRATGRSRRRRLAWLALAATLAGCARTPAPVLRPSAGPGTTVSRDACFPVDGLPQGLRAKNEALLLSALDSEAVYTMLADIKPVSAGFASWRIDLAAPATADLDDTRRMLATWTCGDALAAGAHHFERVYDNKKPVQAWVARRPAVRALVARRATFFAPLGVTPHADIAEVLLAVEYAEPPTRFRGYGWLFGYPDYAVDFFVSAAASEEATGVFVKRDFRSVPVFARATQAFVWARPAGAADTAADLDIDARARPVLETYREWRARYIGPGKPGVVALLRDWLCDARGRCGAQTAVPALAHATP